MNNIYKHNLLYKLFYKIEIYKIKIKTSKC